MFAKCCGATTLGVDGQIIDVEVDVANGLPGVEMIGLPDTMVREAKERVRTAVKNSGIKVMPQKVTINLAPAGIRKDSPGLDLPIAMAMMAAYGIITQESIEGNLFSGELSLEGQVRGVAGILPMAIKAKEMGFKGFFVAGENVNEALLVDGLAVYRVETLQGLIDYLNGKVVWEQSIHTEDEQEGKEVPADGDGVAQLSEGEPEVLEFPVDGATAVEDGDELFAIASFLGDVGEDPEPEDAEGKGEEHA